MRVYARQRGKRLWMLPVPVLTPYLSSLWLGLVTPLYARVGRKLIESIVHPTVAEDHVALRTFAVRPVGVEEAVCRTLAGEEREFEATRWSDALSSSGEPQSWAGVQSPPAWSTRARSSWTCRPRPPSARSSGSAGRPGGRLELVVATPGLSRPAGGRRRHAPGAAVRDDAPRGRRARLLACGDARPNRRLRLLAEMKLPGGALAGLPGRAGRGRSGALEAPADRHLRPGRPAPAGRTRQRPLPGADQPRSSGHVARNRPRRPTVGEAGGGPGWEPSGSGAGSFSVVSRLEPSARARQALPVVGDRHDDATFAGR